MRVGELGILGAAPPLPRDPHLRVGELQDVHENRLLSRWAQLLPRPARAPHGIHEADAELVALPGGGTLALTVDTVSEEIELGLYRSPRTAGRVAAVASLSDLAAVGADPLGLLLSVTLPSDDTQAAQDGVAAGVAEVCTDASTHVLGGDTNIGRQLAVGTVGVGIVPEGVEPLRRTGMKPGDWLLASGRLGLGGALAASRWLGASASFTEADYRPRVTLAVGRSLRGVASACMDTSDGLIATLDQLARLNGLALRLERPLCELLCTEALRASLACGLPPFALLAALHGEFELVFSVPEERLPALGHAGFTPLVLGRAVEGCGLFAGPHPIDGARVRNLLEDVGGDVNGYARGLAALDPEALR